MKKIIALSILMLLVTIFSIDAMGMQPRYPRPDHPHHKNQDTPGSVGAPLDGGLLAVLGAAGVAYMAGRKKKKTTDE